jgi:hypothetical protein
VLLCTVVISVVVLQSSLSSCCSRHCLHSYQRFLSPPNAFYTYARAYPCVCLRHAPVRVHHTPCVIQREKGLGQLAVLVSTGSLERETRKGCVVHCQCLKYIHIYIYIYKLYVYTARETEICGGERCGALTVLEIHIHIYMYIYVYIYIQRERSREMARGER